MAEYDSGSGRQWCRIESTIKRSIFIDRSTRTNRQRSNYIAIRCRRDGHMLLQVWLLLCILIIHFFYHSLTTLHSLHRYIKYKPEPFSTSSPLFESHFRSFDRRKVHVRFDSKLLEQLLISNRIFDHLSLKLRLILPIECAKTKALAQNMIKWFSKREMANKSEEKWNK